MRGPARLQIDSRVATPLPLLLLTLLLVVPASPALGQSLVFSSNTLSVAEGATQTYTLTLATAAERRRDRSRYGAWIRAPPRRCRSG